MPNYRSVKLTLLITLFTTTHVDAYVKSDEIKTSVRQAIGQMLKNQGLVNRKGQRVIFDVSNIDSRLRLADCEHPLDINVKSRKLLGRVTAKVACNGAQPWAIYVPASIKVFKKVVIAQSSLARNQIAQNTHLKLVEKDVSTLTQGYFTEISQIAGKELKRAVAFNGVIAPNMVIEPMAIKKGDEVLIEASAGSLAVRSIGTALANGRIGQQISVRNRSSNRIIKARIIERGLVSVAI